LSFREDLRGNISDSRETRAGDYKCRVAMDDIVKTYDTFGNAAKEAVLKVVPASGGPR
jgi:hypothetical protein